LDGYSVQGLTVIKASFYVNSSAIAEKQSIDSYRRYAVDILKVVAVSGTKANDALT
jgi:hypothetical protein